MTHNLLSKCSYTKFLANLLQQLLTISNHVPFVRFELSVLSSQPLLLLTLPAKLKSF